MATGVQVWSKVPASNANSDSNVNYAEGQAPSSLNDSARAAMASVASWRDDNNGTLVTGGTTTAVTLVTNQVEGALTAGYTVAALLTNTVDVNATLSVDGLAAAPIQIIAGQNISYNILQAGSVQKFTYSTTGTGQWIVQGGVAPQVSSTSTSPLLTVLSNSLAANVTFATTVTDGPQTTQGSSGTWLATGSVSITAPTGSLQGTSVLWDGTTRIDSASWNMGVDVQNVISLSGVLASPVGNIRISSAVTAGSDGTMLANTSGYAKDSSLTVIRIG